jgi:hypothetical protein
MQFSSLSVTSSLLGPNILLSTMLSNTLSLRSSLNVRDKVLHTYKTKLLKLLKILIIQDISAPLWGFSINPNTKKIIFLARTLILIEFRDMVERSVVHVY